MLVRWSPDGRWLSFVANPPGQKSLSLNLYQMAAEGGDPELLVSNHPGSRALWDNCWLPDGHTVVYSSIDRASPGLFQVDVRTRAVSPFPGAERFNYPKCSRAGDILASEPQSDPWVPVEWRSRSLVARVAAARTVAAFVAHLDARQALVRGPQPADNRIGAGRSPRADSSPWPTCAGYWLWLSASPGRVSPRRLAARHARPQHARHLRPRLGGAVIGRDALHADGVWS
jgi:hypothetical protein